MYKTLILGLQCPFEEELLPANADFIYDMARMEHESIDNYANMLCYTIPSLGAIVFFRWVEYVCITLDDLGQVEVDHVMELERAMGKHGSENEELYTLLPCSYEESLSFYQRLMVSQEGHRTLLGQLFRRRGVYEKYKPFVDAYEAVFGQREFKARVTYTNEPSSTVGSAYPGLNSGLYLYSHRLSRSLRWLKGWLTSASINIVEAIAQTPSLAAPASKSYGSSRNCARHLQMISHQDLIEHTSIRLPQALSLII
jgi:hypothetical protein